MNINYPFMFWSVSIYPLAASMRTSPSPLSPFFWPHLRAARSLLPILVAMERPPPLHMLPPSPDSCTVPAANNGSDGALSGVIASPGSGVGDIGSEDHEVVDAAQLCRGGGGGG